MDALKRLNLDDTSLESLNPDAVRVELQKMGLVPVPPLTPRPMAEQSLSSVSWVARLMSALRGTHWERRETERLEVTR